jgi:RHS repeat-associated protein
MGRLNSATANNGSVNLVGSTIYDPADVPLTINLGLGDKDVYVYDNGKRMKNFTFTVGSSNKSVAGVMTWNNSNGTLGTLQITDGWNSGDTQTCTYNYDDILRLGGTTSCVNGPTTLWSQTFSYDRYGNITKSGSQSFMPGYNASTNQYSGLLNATYDNNGNLTNDGTNGYTFDGFNFVASVVTSSGPNGIVRDAFGRMVEIARSAGTYTEVLYSPIGKTALMSGNNVQHIFAPLPGGAQLEVNGTTYLFHHKDWLGTARFISNRGSRSMYFDTAYAPFGENYVSSGTSDLDFTGQRQDIAAGLYDFQYREYLPVHGRWSSPDPVGIQAVNPMDPQTWNRYTYVADSPMNRIDPLGLCWWDDSCDWGGDWGGGGPFSDGFFPGDDIFTRLHTQLSPQVAQAIAAAISGNWKGLLGSALGGLSSGLPDSCPTEFGCAASGFLSNGSLMGPPWSPEYLKHLAFENSLDEMIFDDVFGGYDNGPPKLFRPTYRPGVTMMPSGIQSMVEEMGTPFCGTYKDDVRSSSNAAKIMAGAAIEDTYGWATCP